MGAKADDILDACACALAASERRAASSQAAAVARCQRPENGNLVLARFAVGLDALFSSARRHESGDPVEQTQGCRRLSVWTPACAGVSGRESARSERVSNSCLVDHGASTCGLTQLGGRLPARNAAMLSAT
jgi:hypothetical protein